MKKKTLLFFIVLFFAGLSCKKEFSFRFVAGFEGGTYYKIGQSLNSIPGFKFEVQKTDGSLDNILRLAANKADFSLTQLDMLQNYAIGEPDIKGKVKILMPLYGEEVHLLAKKSIQNLQDLKGKTISIGPSDSGIKISSLIFLSQIGLKEEDIKLEEFKTEKALAMLVEGKLDAVVIIAGAPVKALSDLDKSVGNKIHLLEFAEGLYQSVRGTNLMYQKAEIPAGMYSWQEKSIRTLLVQSVLISRAEIDIPTIEEFVDNIFSNQISLGSQHSKWKGLNKKQVKLYFEKSPDLYHPAMKKIISNF